MSENPIRQIRKKSGLTIVAFANLLRCSVPQIQQIERGALHSSPLVFNALSALGYENIEEEYKQWKQQKAEEAREKLAPRDRR